MMTSGTKSILGGAIIGVGLSLLFAMQNSTTTITPTSIEPTNDFAITTALGTGQSNYRKITDARRIYKITDETTNQTLFAEGTHSEPLRLL